MLLAQIIISALTNGAVYGLIALGFVLIYKGTGVVNFGYGDQVTTGAYFALIPMTFFGVPYWPAVITALLSSALLGMLIYGLFMWPLRNQSLLARIIATLAYGTALREFMRAFMGPNAGPFPFLLSPGAVSVDGVLVVPLILRSSARRFPRPPRRRGSSPRCAPRGWPTRSCSTRASR